MKLTEAQRKTLSVLTAYPAVRPAYPRLNFKTLNALERRGFVKADRSKLGAFYSPHTSIDWRITPAGRAALEQSKEGKNAQPE